MNNSVKQTIEGDSIINATLLYFTIFNIFVPHREILMTVRAIFYQLYRS